MHNFLMRNLIFMGDEEGEPGGEAEGGGEGGERGEERLHGYVDEVCGDDCEEG